jgi:hypothetical protein
MASGLPFHSRDTRFVRILIIVRTSAARLAWTVVIQIGVLAAAPGGDGPLDERALLREIGFSSSEIERIARGETVAKSTQADAAAVALAVAATVDAPASFYLQQFRDIESFKKTPEVQQIGRFSREPSAADMVRLTLDAADVNDLKRCRAGDCDVKLDTAGIAALASHDARVDSSSAALREYLAAYTRNYIRSGNSALIHYADGSAPRSLFADLRVILERSAYLQRGWPTLFEAVGGFDGTLPAALDDFVYWSKEKIGPRPVISITHAIVSPLRNGSAAIATKQIYATHYGHASLGVTMLLDRGTASAPSTRVIYVNRSRLDIFGGLFGSIKRTLVRSRAREGAERTMERVRERMRRSYAAGR